MGLTETQQAKFGEWYSERVTNEDCHGCGGSEWEMALDFGVVAMLPVTEDEVAFEGATLTVVPLICEKCGLVRMFSAEKAGLHDDEGGFEEDSDELLA